MMTSRRDSERARRRVAQPVDLVVDRAVLLDVRVGRRQVRLGLVVVVVGDEVLDPVLREQLPELGRELRGEALVGRHHQRRPVGLGDHVGDRERLPRARDAEQRLEPVAARHALDERSDRLGLVAGGREISDELEIGHSAMVPTKRDRNSQGLSVVRGGLRLGRRQRRGPFEEFLPDRFDLAFERREVRAVLDDPGRDDRRSSSEACSAIRRSASSCGIPRASRRSSRTFRGASTTITAS